MLSLFLNAAMSLNSEILAEGGLVALLGLTVVISSLILIMILLNITGKVFAKLDLKNKKKEEPEIKAAPQAIARPETANDDEAEILAAIMAAISACSEKPLTSFRVVKFKERI